MCKHSLIIFAIYFSSVDLEIKILRTTPQLIIDNL